MCLWDKYFGGTSFRNNEIAQLRQSLQNLIMEWKDDREDLEFLEREFQRLTGQTVSEEITNP